jgi:hypothetical protein
VQEEASRLLERQITRRFGRGVVSDALHRRLTTAKVEELEQWGDNSLEAKTLDGVFH